MGERADLVCLLQDWHSFLETLQTKTVASYGLAFHGIAEMLGRPGTWLSVAQMVSALIALHHVQLSRWAPPT